ncbi:MAG TPA: hypothetical protein VGZ01_09885 [Trinickia sp.]|nr:hypothetical protein [Trinickia sp.]
MEPVHARALLAPVGAVTPPASACDAASAAPEAPTGAADATAEPALPVVAAPALPAGVEAALPVAAEPPTAAVAAAAGPDEVAGAPDASSAGTFSTAPSFKRLASPRANADGLASKMAFDARLSTARSCDCVTAIATSLSDCPGLTLTVVPAVTACAPDANAGPVGATAAEAANGAEAVEAAPPGAAARAAAGDALTPPIAAAAMASAIERLRVLTV